MYEGERTMKKIMFSERYGLQQAVLDGTKTMTCRIVPEGTIRMEQMEVGILGGNLADRIKDHSLYLWHEEIAVAQSYRTLIETGYLADEREDGWVNEKYIVSAGFRNKMFVKAKYMPHRIRITSIRIERLQDISEEDCLREGVEKWIDCYIVSGIMENHGKNNVCFDTPREAFVALIDRISGRGTWQRNPWVYVYEFKLCQ